MGRLASAPSSLMRATSMVPSIPEEPPPAGGWPAG